MLLSRIASIALFVIWVALVVFMGKGGFVHLLLLSAIGVGFAELMINYRTRLAS
jgi:hypothetical protein